MLKVGDVVRIRPECTAISIPKRYAGQIAVIIPHDNITTSSRIRVFDDATEWWAKGHMLEPLDNPKPTTTS